NAGIYSGDGLRRTRQPEGNRCRAGRTDHQSAGRRGAGQDHRPHRPARLPRPPRQGPAQVAPPRAVAQTSGVRPMSLAPDLLAMLEKTEFGLQSATLVAGNTDAVTAYFPSHRLGVLGGAIYLVDYGDLDRTDATGNTIGRISPRNLEFVASYAAGIAGGVTFGVNYKLVQFVVDCSGD